MTKIVNKEILNENTILMDLHCPLIAQKALAGQFVILRVDEFGERIPLTISDCHQDNIRIIFQAIGKTTLKLSRLNCGDEILDVVGPLGKPTDLNADKVAIVLGGLGCAIGYMSAKQLYQNKAEVDIICGFKNKDLIILQKEMEAVSDNLYICTDDGSYGFKGFVSDKLSELLQEKEYDLVVTVGPLIMMKVVSKVTAPLNIKTLASMNPIMMDGSGMCGCCRLSYENKIKFACVDGPDFEADKVDFDELMVRNNFYRQQEQQALDHYCQLLKKETE